jgi:hypothetical protein
MNRYMMISRLRWPAILLLTGIIALLDQADILSWGRAWPLYLILFGVLALAERATLTSEPPPPSYPYGAGYQAAGYPPPAGSYPGAYAVNPEPPPPTSPGTGIVPSHGSPLEVRSTEFGSNREEEER